MGEFGSCSGVGAMLSKSLIQFSVDGKGCFPSLLFGLRPNYSKGKDNGDLLQKDLCPHCCIQCPWPHSRPLSTHAFARDSWTLTGKSGSVSCGTQLLSPVSCCTQCFVCAVQESVSPVSDITVTEFLFLGSKITAYGDCCNKIRHACSLEEKLWPT